MCREGPSSLTSSTELFFSSLDLPLILQYVGLFCHRNVFGCVDMKTSHSFHVVTSTLCSLRSFCIREYRFENSKAPSESLTLSAVFPSGIICRPADQQLARAGASSVSIAPVACQSAPMDPRGSWGAKSVISFDQGFRENV